MNPRSWRLTEWLLLIGWCGFLFFFGLARFGLVGADEPRYAQVAREMLDRHDWITPTLGGKPWLEKPPLYYWQAMLAYRIFGVSDWAARLPSAMDATLMIIAVYLFLRRFRPGLHLEGALMTVSAAGIIGFARAASTDMPLAATFTVALLTWYAWHESGNRHYLALFYFFLALGTLAKGPVAPLLAVAVIAIFALAKGEKKPITQTLWVPGAAVFFIVVLPWYIAVQLRNPEFFRVFILQHNLARFSTNLYHHREPFWYYLPVVLLALVPWTVFVGFAWLKCARAGWAERRKIFQSDAISAFLVLWLTVPVVLFSISRSKLPGYILPALPAGALLLVEYVRRQIIDEQRPGTMLVLLHSAVACLPMIPALMIRDIVLQHRLPWNRATAISSAFAVLFALFMAVTLRSGQGLRGLRFVTLVPVVLTVAAALRLGSSVLDASLSARPLAAEISRVQTHPVPLAIMGVSRETEYGLQFYRNESIVRYEMGQIPGAEHLLVAPEGSQRSVVKWAAGRRVSYLGSFAPQGLDYYWVSAAGTQR